MDLNYYKKRAICIYPRVEAGRVPPDSELGSFLEGFGTRIKSHDIWKYCVKDGASIKGPPNTAVVIFDSPDAVERALESSKDAIIGSLWLERSIAAKPFGRGGPLDRIFATKIFPKVLKLDEGSSRRPPQPGPSQPTHPSLGDHRPPKRPRTESTGGASNNTSVTGGHTLAPGPSRTSSATPDSPEWMRARIAQLEAELYTAKAACDMAVSEQEVIRTAHRGEQRGRREAMSQKSAAEAALSRKQVEQDRLRSDLEISLAQKSALSNELDALRRQFAAAEDKLRIAQSSFDESTNYNEQTKALESELKEARDQVHQLQLRLQGSSQEVHATNPETIKPDDSKAKIKELKSKVKQLKADLISTNEQLTSTQSSLESMEQKYSSTRGKYKSTRAELGVYKERLENERGLTKKLRETLTPAAYQSLGATHETLGAFLSAMDLPPVDEDGNTAPKEEMD